MTEETPPTEPVAGLPGWAARDGATQQLPSVPAGYPSPAGPAPVIVYVEQPRRRRRWPWIIGLLAIFTCLGCCGIGAAVIAPITGEYPARVVVGKHVAQFKRDDRPAVALIAEEVRHRIVTEQRVDSAFAARLIDPTSAGRSVLIFGATELIWNPGAAMRAVITGAGDHITDVTKFDAGPLGGELACARGTDDQQARIVACAWIDHGSFGVGIFYGGRSMPNSAEALRQIRSAVLTRPGGR